MNSSGSLCLKHGEASDPLSGSIAEFLYGGFSTKLEDPRTGRKVI